jgi:hypothetical protein
MKVHRHDRIDESAHGDVSIAANREPKRK